ncbi:hypothetical protein VTI74DRAFT_9525 [Chaetomium olivicolor]
MDVDKSSMAEAPWHLGGLADAEDALAAGYSRELCSCVGVTALKTASAGRLAATRSSNTSWTTGHRLVSSTYQYGSTTTSFRTSTERQTFSLRRAAGKVPLVSQKRTLLPWPKRLASSTGCQVSQRGCRSHDYPVFSICSEARAASTASPFSHLHVWSYDKTQPGSAKFSTTNSRRRSGTMRTGTSSCNQSHENVELIPSAYNLGNST